VCDPISLTIAATAVAAVGQGVSAYSTYQQDRYEAKVATANAAIKTDQASDALARGRIDNLRYQRQLAQQMGEQNARLAANGIDIGYGSAANVRADTAMFGREDVNTINENAIRETKGYEVDAMNYRAEASAKKSAATGALIQGAFGVASTVLGGATQVSKMRTPAYSYGG
jgi:hypothetical protein